MNYSLTKKQAKDLISGKLSHYFGVGTNEATNDQYYQAVAMIVKDLMHDGVRERRKAADEAQAKRVYYLSMEFLMGRSLKNNLYNLNLTKTFDAALPTIAAGCRRVTEFAAEHGIATMVENHGQFCQESTRVEKLVGAVDHSNFGLLVDVGNFLCADEPSVSAVARVAAFARHVHVKDFHVKSGSEPNPGRGFFGTRGGNYLRGAILGHGDVPVYQCLRILHEQGYDGYVSIEFEGMEDNLPALEIGLENLQNYIAMM